MPMLIKIVELDFSWPSFNSGLYWVAHGLKIFTVAGTANDFNINYPPRLNTRLLIIEILKMSIIYLWIFNFFSIVIS